MSPIRAVQVLSSASREARATIPLLAAELPGQGFAIELVGTVPVLSQFPQGLDVTRRTMPIPESGSVTKDPAAIWKLHRLYPSIDLVHAHSAHAGAVAALAMTGLPARLRPKLLVSLPQPRRGSRENTALSALIARSRADLVLAGSEQLAASIAAHGIATERLFQPVSPQRPAVPARSTAEVRARLGIPAGTWLVSSPAAIDDAPEFAALLGAVRTFRDAYPTESVHLALTGSGPRRDELVAAAAGAGAGLSVVPATEADATLRAADIVVATATTTRYSDDDLLALTRPLVVVGSARYGAYFGDAAETAATADEVRAALHRLVTNPQLRGALAIRAHERVFGDATRGAVVAQLVRSYRGLVGLPTLAG